MYFGFDKCHFVWGKIIYYILLSVLLIPENQGSKLTLQAVQLEGNRQKGKETNENRSVTLEKEKTQCMPLKPTILQVHKRSESRGITTAGFALGKYCGLVIEMINPIYAQDKSFIPSNTGKQ